MKTNPSTPGRQRPTVGPRYRPRRLRQLIVGLIAAVTVLPVSTVILPPGIASASHFRANQLTWHLGSGSTNTAEFHFSGATRWTFYGSPAVGTTFTGFSVDLGDGTSVSPDLTVVAVDAANDVLTFDSHFTHTYAASGPWTVAASGCCRLSTSGGHLNNPDGSLTISTLVDLAQTSASPVSSISPIVDCPTSGICNFFIPAIDADGQGLQWRLSTDVEASGSVGGFTQPPGATVNATTGLYSWDTTGVALNPDPTGPTFYSTQVTIENVVGGVVISTAAVDFFIRLGTGTTNQAPVFIAPTPADGTIINGTVGAPLTFSTAAQDPDTGDTVTLGATGLPVGASYTGVPGNPATATFNWTPTTTGDTILTLTATDQSGFGALQRSVILRIGAGQVNTPPIVDAGLPTGATEGSPATLDGMVGDLDAADTLTSAWTYTPGAGVDAGASCSFADASAVDTSITCTDDGTYTATLTVSDGVNPAVSDDTTVTVTNADPTVSITSPADGATVSVGNLVTVTASLADAGTNDSHICDVDWGDGTTSSGVVAAGTCTASHTYLGIAVPTVTVTITDDDGGVGTASIMLVVIDGTTKVTGGGFIIDGGRTSFGFVAKDDGAGGYRGQVQVRSERNRFHGSTVSSLAVSGNTATWSGAGKWNGTEGYTFEVSVVDNRNGGSRKKSTAADQIHIVIRDAGGAVVLDASGDLKGGNLVVH